MPKQSVLILYTGNSARSQMRKDCYGMTPVTASKSKARAQDRALYVQKQ